jgi:hypothetical protein
MYEQLVLFAGDWAGGALYPDLWSCHALQGSLGVRD